MKFKLFMVILLAITFITYVYSWYNDEMVPAWQAAIWSFYCFTYALEDYVTARFDSLNLD
jgi:hypothetical protein